MSPYVPLLIIVGIVVLALIVLLLVPRKRSSKPPSVIYVGPPTDPLPDVEITAYPNVDTVATPSYTIYEDTNYSEEKVANGSFISCFFWSHTQDAFAKNDPSAMFSIQDNGTTIPNLKEMAIVPLSYFGPVKDRPSDWEKMHRELRESAREIKGE